MPEAGHLWLSCWRRSSCGCGSMSHCPKDSGVCNTFHILWNVQCSNCLLKFYKVHFILSLSLSLSPVQSWCLSAGLAAGCDVCVSLHSGFCCRRWVRSVLCGVGKHSCPYRQRTRQTARETAWVWSKALEASDLDGSNLPEPQWNLLLIMAEETDTTVDHCIIMHTAHTYALGLTTHTSSITAVFMSYYLFYCLFIEIKYKCRSFKIK